MSADKMLTWGCYDEREWLSRDVMTEWWQSRAGGARASGMREASDKSLATREIDITETRQQR
jgi:hypothetical protein